MAATNRTPIGCLNIDLVRENVARLGGDLSEIGDGYWSYKNPRGRTVRATIRIEQNWVVMESPLAGSNLSHHARMRRRIWSLLKADIYSVTGTRAVLPVADNQVMIRAETPLSTHLPDESERLVQWFESVSTELNNWFSARSDAGARVQLQQTPATVTEIDIPALCDMAGWSASVRSRSGETTVAVHVRDNAVCQAMVTQQSGFVQFWMPLEMAGGGELTPASQFAVAIALLRLAGEVRLVRTTALRVNGCLSAALDVRLPTPVSSELINHALSALALAHRQIAQELDALASDDFLASAYLAMQGVV